MWQAKPGDKCQKTSILNTWTVGDQSFHLQASQSQPARFEKLPKVGNLTSASPWFATNWSLEGEEEVRGIWPTRFTFHRFLFLFFCKWICQKVFYIRPLWFLESSLFRVNVRMSEDLYRFHKFGDTSSIGHWSAIEWSAVSDSTAPLSVVFADCERNRSQCDKKVKVVPMPCI